MARKEDTWGKAKKSISENKYAGKEETINNDFRRKA
jgi:hypothetical protein